MAVSEGKRRGYWKASHNMFTQMSSEIGLPGAFVFVYLIVVVWRSFTRAEKAHPAAFQFAREIRHMAFCLKLSTLVFALCGLTLSMGYGVLLPMLCGFSFVMDRLLASARVASKAEETSQEGEARPVTPAAAPAFARMPAPIARR